MKILKKHDKILTAKDFWTLYDQVQSMSDQIQSLIIQLKSERAKNKKLLKK